jgi:hypothetical protein
LSELRSARGKRVRTENFPSPRHFQSRNKRYFPCAEYLFSIGVCHGRLPQIVLYVGEKPMRMKDRIEGSDYSVRFHLVDARDLDGARLLASPNMGDNLIAILTRLGNQPDTVNQVSAMLRCGIFHRCRLAQIEG